MGAAEGNALQGGGREVLGGGPCCGGFGESRHVRAEQAEPAEPAKPSRAGPGRPGGAEPSGVEPGGAEPGGAESGGAEPSGAERGRAESGVGFGVIVRFSAAGRAGGWSASDGEGRPRCRRADRAAGPPCGKSLPQAATSADPTLGREVRARANLSAERPDQSGATHRRCRGD